ncbi:hypothetical protein Tco_0309575 [Tanacetum coccineum]
MDGKTKNALWEFWIKGGDNEVLLDHIVSSDNERQESNSTNHLNDNSDFNLCVILFLTLHQLVSEPKFLIKMSPKRSESEESEYLFFKGDGSSSDEWRDYGMASDDCDGPPIFDDDQYEDVIKEEEGFVDNYSNFQRDETNVSFSGVVLGVEEESMPVYDTDIEDAIEEEGFVRKGGFGVLDGVVPTTPSRGVEDKEVENILANENSTSGVGFLKKQVDTSESDKWIPPVHFYAYESGQKVLDILKPSEIIVYHPDIAFVREIKVYKAKNPSKKVKLYFLFYEDSIEVQKFEASICRENGTFESLIRQKSMMIQLVDQVAHGR